MPPPCNEPRPLPNASIVEPGLKLDCRHYRGDRPCTAGIQGVCPEDCARHDPMGRRILIIKLGALGDVIRTAALLPGLKEVWPTSHVTWVTRPAAVRVLANHPLIDRRLPFDAETMAHLECEHFDLCLSLDKEPAPAALAMRVHADDRRGIGLSRFGTVFPLNPECVPYFRLGLDDGLKFRENRKTYPQLIYESVGLPYRGQRYRLYPDPENRRRAAAIWRRGGVHAGETVIGLNTGAGEAFANKTWPPEKFARLAEQLVRRHGWRVALLGGSREAEANRQIAGACANLQVCRGREVLPGVLNVCDGADLRRAGTPHLSDSRGAELGELDFAALVERCDVVVTGDTLAMHMGIAADIPCVVLFGPTCAQEIDLYGRGTHVRTRLTCSPCYKRVCRLSPNCMDDISLEQVLAAVERWAAAEQPASRPAVTVGA